MLGVLWFVLVGVLIVGYAVFDGFDLGIGVLYPVLGGSEEDRWVMRRSIGPVWDGNEVWLLTAGGALFAAFPPVYATVFSGFYLALMLVLFALIFRAAAIEFRSHDRAWARFWDVAFFLGSALPALLFGVAAGNIIRGVPLDAMGEYAGDFFTLLNPFALIIGFVGLVWFMLQGASWLAVKSLGKLHARTVRLRLSLLVTFAVLLAAGTGAAAWYVPNVFFAASARPLSWVFVVLAILALFWAWISGLRGTDLSAFYGSSLAAVAIVGLWAVAIFPALVPSLGPGRSLTIANSASSQLTLTVMTIIAAIGVPLVLFYFYLIYRTFAGRIQPATDDSHY